MTMNTNMASHVHTAISGLIFAAEQINEALMGSKYHFNAQVAQQSGPLASAMQRLSAIASGAEIQDKEAVRKDLQFAFPLIRHQCGGFYTSMQTILFAAHVRCADLITSEEAQAVMGEYAVWLRLEAALGHIHLIVREDGQEWRGYDATYLGEPGEWLEVRYAGYEIRARRAKYVKEAEDLKRWQAERQTEPVAL